MSGSEDVSISDIRTSLGEIDASYIPDDTIHQAIEIAEIEVDDRVSNQRHVDQKKRRVAIIAKARRIAFTSIPHESRIQAVDATVQYDLDGFMEELEYRDEHMTELLTGSNTASFRSPRSR